MEHPIAEEKTPRYIKDMAEQRETNIRELVRHWWLFLLQGILTIFIGWFLLKSPAITVIQLAIVLGIYLLISGIFDTIGSLFEIGKKDSHWGWRMFGGLLNIMIGLFAINNPVFTGVFTPVVILYFVAAGFVVNGIVHMVIGNEDRQTGMRHWSWGSFFVGVLYLLLGFMLFSTPTLVAAKTVVWVGGLFSIMGGIGMIIFAFQVKGLDKKAS